MKFPHAPHIWRSSLIITNKSISAKKCRDTTSEPLLLDFFLYEKVRKSPLCWLPPMLKNVERYRRCIAHPFRFTWCDMRFENRKALGRYISYENTRGVVMHSVDSSSHGRSGWYEARLVTLFFAQLAVAETTCWSAHTLHLCLRT